MTYFLTKVWGFSEPVGPLIFREQGWRTNAIGKLQPGDRVLLVGTKGEPTDPDEQGRLLGIMEPTTEPVMSLDYPVRQNALDFDEQGNYRWPYGLLNVRAWRLLDRPLLSEISNRPFAMDAASGIVALTDDEAAKVSALNMRPAEMAQATAQARHRIERATGPTRWTAPPPTTTRAGVMHMRRANAVTYAMELIGASEPAIKVGWAFDWKLRQKGFNHAALPSLGGVQYKTWLFHRWNTAVEAFRFEQRILKHFTANRHLENSEVLVGLHRREFERAWQDILPTVFLG